MLWRIQEVELALSSEEYSRCGHVAAEGRKSQADFHCALCGHAQNGGNKAADVILASERETIDKCVKPKGLTHCCLMDIRQECDSGFEVNHWSGMINTGAGGAPVPEKGGAHPPQDK